MRIISPSISIISINFGALHCLGEGSRGLSAGAMATREWGMEFHPHIRAENPSLGRPADRVFTFNSEVSRGSQKVRVV